MRSEIQNYQKVMLETASPVQQVILLYEKCIAWLQKAKRNMESGKIAAKGQAIGKAIDIVVALNSNLDIAQGEIPENLHLIYQLSLEKLSHANRHNDPQAIEQVEQWMSNLLESWRQVERLTTPVNTSAALQP